MSSYFEYIVELLDLSDWKNQLFLLKRFKLKFFENCYTQVW